MMQPPKPHSNNNHARSIEKLTNREKNMTSSQSVCRAYQNASQKRVKHGGQIKSPVVLGEPTSVYREPLPFICIVSRAAAAQMALAAMRKLIRATLRPAGCSRIHARILYTVYTAA